MWRYLLLTAAIGLPASGAAVAQATLPPPNTGIPSQQRSSEPNFPGGPNPEMDALLEHARYRSREIERQRRIVDDANRLVKLTAQYRADVERHGTVTAEDEKLLVMIEKLAREVKDRMRGM